jgi:hypothetical protein
LKKDLAANLDMEGLVKDIKSRMRVRIDSTYELSLETYLTEFLIPGLNPDLAAIIEVARTIITKEFSIECSDDNKIIIERNTKKRLEEYVREALEILDEPSKIESIYEYIYNNFLEIEPTIESIRTTLSGEEFIYFGRASTYGLAKWENEREGIKGGTIRDIVSDFLETKNEPVHIFEIADEVQKYRPKTNSTSILSNLSQVEKDKFILFNQGFVGLHDKVYVSNLTHLPKMLGRVIREYVRENIGISISDLTDYFAEEQSISKENMRRILLRLVENKYISIDDKGKVYLEANISLAPVDDLDSTQETETSTPKMHDSEYSAGFKMEVVLAVLRYPDSIIRLAKDYNIPLNTIKKWRHQLILNAPRVFID